MIFRMDYSQHDFEVLMSCMNQSNFDIGFRSKVDSDLLIINQTNINGYEEIEVNGHLWRMISTTERGLSKSRNMALKNARGKICLLSDDDQFFLPEYKEIICKAFRELPEATVIAFNINRINNQIKKRYYVIEKSKEASKVRGFQSSMLAMKIEQIKEKKIFFDERFGSGTDWGGGEETLFQEDIRKNGLRIFEYPEIIATVDYSQGSQWFHGFDRKYFYNIGAFSVCRNRSFFKREAYYIYLAFLKLRKDKKLSPLEKIKWIHLGEKGWRNHVPYKCFVEK